MSWLVLLLLVSPLIECKNLESTETTASSNEDFQTNPELLETNSLLEVSTESASTENYETEITLESTTTTLLTSTNFLNSTVPDAGKKNKFKIIFPSRVEKTVTEAAAEPLPLKENNDLEVSINSPENLNYSSSKEERVVRDEWKTTLKDESTTEKAITKKKVNDKNEVTSKEVTKKIVKDPVTEQKVTYDVATAKVIITATTSEPEGGDQFITTLNGGKVPVIIITDVTPLQEESTTHPTDYDDFFPEAPKYPSLSPTDNDLYPYMENVDSCMSKCCPLGQSLAEDKKTCVKTKIEFLPRFQSDRPLPKAVYLELGLKCQFGRYRLEPLLDSDDEFYILTNGTLFLPYQIPHYYSCKEYCLESFLIDEEAQTLPLICFTPQETQEDSWADVRRILYSSGCMISVPFLLITLIIYITCPQLRTTNGKVLCCHISSLAVAYSSLTFVQIAGDTLSHTNCVIVAFTVQFSFLTSFFWLNVLCFNTWRRLRYKIRKHKHDNNHVGGRTFLYYSIYGWGAPIGFFMVTLVMDLNPSIPSSYLKPNFGFETCWFQDETSALSYFYAPIALILVANLALFVMSAFHVWTNHKMSTEMAKRSNGKWDIGDVALQVIRNRRKMVFMECLMLFLVMGLNWVWEVVSWRVAGPQQLWFVTDMFNTLQGVIVFYVFVWRDSRAWRHFTKPAICAKCRAAREPIDPRRHSNMSFVTTRRPSSIVVDRRSSTPFMDPLIRYTPTPTDERQHTVTTFTNHKKNSNKK